MNPVVGVGSVVPTARPGVVRSASTGTGGGQQSAYAREFAAAKAVEAAMAPFMIPAPHAPRTASEAEFAEYLLLVTGGDSGAVLRSLSEPMPALYTPSTAAIAMNAKYVEKPESRQFK